MKYYKKIISIFCVFALIFTLISNYKITSSIAATSVNGFKVSGTKLLDAKGNQFILRGINHANAWWKNQLDTVIPAIAQTGANSVRIALGDGEKWGYDDINTVRKVITLCEQYKLVAVLEVHDATGTDNVSSLNNAVNYWIAMKDALIGKEDKVIINIANEWYGTWNGHPWADGYINAIKSLRSAGLNHTLMVDCAGWGQYPQSIFDYGTTVFNADPQKNTMFSIHMYEYAGGTATQVKSNIDNVLNKNLAVVIGEFGLKHTNGDVDEATIMSYCKEKSVGWMAWSWYGNGNDWIYLDMSTDWSGTNYTEWGNIVVNSTNGLKQTSTTCSIYSSTNPNSNNLALNKPAYTSSAYNSSLSASYAFDGNSSTRWSSLYSDPQYIYVDLGTTYNVNRVVLKWETAYGKNYNIQVSTDGTTWTNVYTKSNGTGGTDDLSFNGTNARYVKLYGTARGTSWGYSLYEFEVYGTAATTGGASFTPVKIEAENSTLNGTVIESSNTGYTGSGYVTSFDNNGDYVQFTANVPTSGSYNLTIRYSAPNGTKYNSVYVNGSNIGQKTFSQTSNFQDLLITNISLNSGSNTIKIQKDSSDWGWILADYIIISK